MAHELTFNKEKQEHEMFYTGEKPWHGLGQELDGPATAEEAMMAANLAWSVSRRNVSFTKNDMVSSAEAEEYKAIVRDDNDTILSIMKNSYTPVQNIEAFAFIDSIVGEGYAMYETAGSLFGGKKIFLVVKIPGTVNITKKDKVERYLTLMNSHDGSSALQVYFTPIRVVCNNTLEASLGSKENTFKMRHRSGIINKIEEAREILDITNTYYDNFEFRCKQLLDKKLDAEAVEKLINEIYKVEDGEKVATKKENQISDIMDLYYNDPKNNLDGIGGTAWSLYNAITEYADHYSQSTLKTADGRMNSIIRGTSANYKARALEIINR